MTCSTDQKVSGPGLLDASVPLNLDRSVSFVAGRSDERVRAHACGKVKQKASIWNVLNEPDCRTDEKQQLTGFRRGFVHVTLPTRIFPCM